MSDFFLIYTDIRGAHERRPAQKFEDASALENGGGVRGYAGICTKRGRHAAAVAYGEDWRTSVPDKVAASVCKILGGQPDLLLRDQPNLQLEALRQMTAGHGLGQVLIDCAIQQAASGKLGVDAAVEATAAALAIWGARHAREIEEHYFRKTSDRRAQNVRARIEEGIGGSSLTGIARQLLKIDGAPSLRTPPKQTGLDDGVQL